jgi:hypothetical protein
MKLFHAVILSASLAVIAGCGPEAPVYPVEPILTFKQYIHQPGSDSLQVVFGFTDGDGDVGTTGSSQSDNLKLTVYHRNPTTGRWEPIEIMDPNGNSDSLQYGYRIPPISMGQSGLQGEIYVTINKAILALTEDTVQFNAFLLDQSYHQSAVIRTPEVVLTP